MPFIRPRDRVQELSTSNSQSVFAVTGAIDTSYNSFGAFMAVGDTTIGGIVEPGVAFKSGVLTYTGTNQITVSNVFESKGVFSAGGAKQVFMGAPGLWLPQSPAMSERNIFINAACEVNQEVITAVVLTNNTAKYVIDGWEAMYNHGAGTAVLSAQHHGFAGAFPGFSLGHRITASTAITSPASGDFALHRQKVEGYRIAHWGWGYAGAKPASFAFWLYSVAGGPGFVRLRNGSSTRFLYHEFTVANGFNFVSFSVPGDTSGTWAVDNTVGLVFEVFVSGKETTPQASLDTWGGTAKVQTTNSTNLLGTNGNLTVLFGAWGDVGLQRPSPDELADLMRSFDKELELCKRYWEKSYNYTIAPGSSSSSGLVEVLFPSNSVANLVDYPSVSYYAKRASPTVVCYGYAGTPGRISTQNGTELAAGSGIAGATGENSFINRNQSGGTLTLTNNIVYFHWTADARL